MPIFLGQSFREGRFFCHHRFHSECCPDSASNLGEYEDAGREYNHAEPIQKAERFDREYPVAERHNRDLPGRDGLPQSPRTLGS